MKKINETSEIERLQKALEESQKRVEKAEAEKAQLKEKLDANRAELKKTKRQLKKKKTQKYVLTQEQQQFLSDILPDINILN